METVFIAAIMYFDKRRTEDIKYTERHPEPTSKHRKLNNSRSLNKPRKFKSLLFLFLKVAAQHRRFKIVN